MSEQVKLGKVAMTLGGDYSSSQSYDKLTCVHYDGCSWVSKKQVPEGVAPTSANSAYWQKISDRGVQGPQGQSYVDKELVPIVNDLTTGGSANVLSAEQGKVLKGELAELSEKTTNELISLTEPSAGYINKNGVYVNSEAFIYYTINVKKGDLFTITQEVSSAVAVFATQGAIADTYRVLLVSDGTNREYHYVCDFDGVLYISTRPNVKTLRGLRGNGFDKIVESIDKTTFSDIFPIAEKSELKQYVRYSDGELVATGSLIHTFTLSNCQYRSLRVFVTGADNYAAPIAFYNTEKPSTESYMKDASLPMIANMGGGNWYEVNVPSDCVTIVITNHMQLEPNPQIMVNSLASYVKSIQGSSTNMNPSSSANVGASLFLKKKFYGHLFEINESLQGADSYIIPQQSLFDIQLSKRLGFDIIEANIRETSDRNAIVMHGNNGAFGYEVVDLNGEFTYATTQVSTKPLAWIKENIRYRSTIGKYNVAPLSLEEFLLECKKNNMIPLVELKSGYVDIVDKIMGKGNYIAYIQQDGNATRQDTSALITTYKGFTTKAEILEECEKYGVPYMYCMSNPTWFDDEQLADIVQTLHEEGYMISSAYLGRDNVDRVLRLGFDGYAARWEVNDFDSGNLVNLNSEFSYEGDYTTTGTLADDGAIELSANQNIKNKATMDKVQFGMSQVNIVFKGDIKVRIGDFANNGTNERYTSEEYRSLVISSRLLNESPSLLILGMADGTRVLSVTYKVSKC